MTLLRLIEFRRKGMGFVGFAFVIAILNFSAMTVYSAEMKKASGGGGILLNVLQGICLQSFTWLQIV